MQIIVYTKKDCGVCAALKDKLLNILKLPFAECDLELALLQTDTWQEDGTVKVRTGQAAIHGLAPMTFIDGQAYDYAATLKEIKRRLAEGEEATMPESVPGSEKDPLKQTELMNEATFVAHVHEVCEGTVDQLEISSPLIRRYDGRTRERIQEEGKPPVHVTIGLRKTDPLVTANIQESGDTFNDVIVRVRTRYPKLKEKKLM